GGRVPLAAMARLARLKTARMAAALAPRSLAAPTISGSPVVGQTLTSSTGTWTGSPSSFSYQWQRCDSAGASCASIAGASGESYPGSADDAGSSIRVSVTARNGFGTATAQSAPTGVVAGSGAPANTSLPAISGVAQSGQTLSGSTGSWTGSPTNFAFQWQRC